MRGPALTPSNFNPSGILLCRASLVRSYGRKIMSSVKTIIERVPITRAAHYEWMVSAVKQEDNPVEGNTILKDYDKGSMK
jgi:hypothetical protein